MALIIRLIGGFLARFWQPIATFLGGWLARGQRETIKDQREHIKTRDRIDEADTPTDADDARRMLRERADKRNL